MTDIRNESVVAAFLPLLSFVRVTNCSDWKFETDQYIISPCLLQHHGYVIFQYGDPCMQVGTWGNGEHLCVWRLCEWVSPALGLSKYHVLVKVTVSLFAVNFYFLRNSEARHRVPKVFCMPQSEQFMHFNGILLYCLHIAICQIHSIRLFVITYIYNM